jgi:hypothetical protein
MSYFSYQFHAKKGAIFGEYGAKIEFCKGLLLELIIVTLVILCLGEYRSM